MLNFAWNPISEAEYDSALGALPPRVHYGEGFLLGEPYSFRRCSVEEKGAGTWSAYKVEGGSRREAGAFYRASEPLTVAEFKTALGRPL